MPTLKDKPNPAAPDPLVVELQERMHVLEAEVTLLKQQVDGQPHPRAYLKTFGMMPDNEATREAERLGRAYRKRQPKC
jgi:hypothetical protein